MRLRAAHLAFVMLLLSTMGVTPASALSSGRGGHNGQTYGILLQQNAPALHPETPLAQRLQATAGSSRIASPAPLRATWSMRPPAAHSAHRQAVTASHV
jgi:hypothetical protein